MVLQSQLKIVCDTILRIKGDNLWSACEVVEESKILCGKIKKRKGQQFFNFQSKLTTLRTRDTM